MMKLQTMSKPQQQRYMYYIMDNRIDKDDYYSVADITKFRHFDKRLSLLKKKLNNPFAFQDVMRHYFEDEPLANIDSFTAYVFLNYKKTQTTLKNILDSMGEWVDMGHHEECEAYCLGMTDIYETENGYEYFSATFTNDLDCVNINF